MFVQGLGILSFGCRVVFRKGLGFAASSPLGVCDGVRVLVWGVWHTVGGSKFSSKCTGS